MCGGAPAGRAPPPPRPVEITGPGSKGGRAGRRRGADLGARGCWRPALPDGARAGAGRGDFIVWTDGRDRRATAYLDPPSLQTGDEGGGDGGVVINPDRRRQRARAGALTGGEIAWPREGGHVLRLRWAHGDLPQPPRLARRPVGFRELRRPVWGRCALAWVRPLDQPGALRRCRGLAHLRFPARTRRGWLDERLNGRGLGKHFPGTKAAGTRARTWNSGEREAVVRTGGASSSRKKGEDGAMNRIPLDQGHGFGT